MSSLADFAGELLGVTLAGGALAAAAVMGMTHDTPEGHFNGHLGTLPPGYDKPTSLPSWRTHADGECEPAKRGVLYDTLLVVRWDGTTTRLPFDQVRALVNDRTWANDVWVIGGCP